MINPALPTSLLLLSFAFAKGRANIDLQNLVEQTNQLKQEEKKAPAPERQAIKQKVEENVRKIDSAADIEPTDFQAKVQVAQALLQVDEAPRALKRADQAVALAPQDPEARTVRAESYYKLHRYEEAAAEAAVALKLDPGSRQAQAVLQMTAGRTSRMSGGSPNAIQADSGRLSTWTVDQKKASAGAAAAPAPGAARTAPPAMLGSQTQADTLKAAELASQALGRLGLGDKAAALALLDRALALNPKSGTAYLIRAKTRLGSADKQESRQAAADAEQAAALIATPGNAPAFMVLAQARQEAGDSKEQVLAAYKAAAELDPSFSDEYRAALAGAGAASASGDEPAKPSAGAGPSADVGPGRGPARLLFGRLPPKLAKAFPWAALAAAAAVGGWLWLARKNAA